METFRLFIGWGVLIAAFLAIPLAGWADRGSARGAWEAVKEYGFLMALICVPAAAVGLFMALRGS
jgi:hypothetical protein